MEVAVTTGATGLIKFQSARHHQQTNTQLLQAGCHSCRPTNSVKALKWKNTDNYLLVNLLLANVNCRWTNLPVLYWNEWKSSWYRSPTAWP